VQFNRCHGITQFHDLPQACARSANVSMKGKKVNGIDNDK
jgi:hypothetical protein